MVQLFLRFFTKGAEMRLDFFTKKLKLLLLLFTLGIDYRLEFKIGVLKGKLVIRQ
jgi:hypothetical protein